MLENGKKYLNRNIKKERICTPLNSIWIHPKIRMKNIINLEKVTVQYSVLLQINTEKVLILKLDSSIFLDRVKNRGCIPFIQSIGRVLRLDKGNTGKTNGFIIDGIYKNENYDRTFVDKILGYYMNLENSLYGRNLDEERNRFDTYVRKK